MCRARVPASYVQLCARQGCSTSSGAGGAALRRSRLLEMDRFAAPVTVRDYGLDRGGSLGFRQQAGAPSLPRHDHQPAGRMTNTTSSGARASLASTRTSTHPASTPKASCSRWKTSRTETSPSDSIVYSPSVTSPGWSAEGATETDVGPSTGLSVATAMQSVVAMQVAPANDAGAV
jgi:hypothetical protein